MKRWTVSYLLLLIIAVPLLITPVLASDTSGAHYSGVISVTNNGTATSAVSVNISGMNSATMINQGWLNATANNYVIQKSGGDVKSMPGYDDNPWIMWVSSISANSTDAYVFYTDTVTGYDPVYFPADAGMTTADAAALEFSDNFTWEASGWIDTDAGNDKWHLRKPGAIEVYTSNTTSENITARIPPVIEGIRLRIKNTAVGAQDVGVYELYINDDTSPTGFSDPAGAWANEGQAYDDNVATFATDAAVGAGAWSEYLILTFPAQSVGNIRIDAYVATNPANEMIELSLYDGSDYTVFYLGTFDTQVMTLHEYLINYTDEVLTVTGISAEEKPEQMKMDWPFMGFAVDDDVTLPPSGDLLLNAPLTQDDCSVDPFTTIDANEYSLNPEGGAVWSSSNGYTLDGASGYIDMTVPGDVLALTEGTLIAVLKPEAAALTANTAIWEGADKDAANDYLGLGIRGDVANAPLEYLLKINGVETVRARVESIFAADTWAFVALTVDATGNAIYADGLPVTPDYTTGNAASAEFFADLAAPDVFRLGVKEHSGVKGQWLDGSIGYFMVYDKAKTPAEILQTYNALKIIFDGTTDKDIRSTLGSVPDTANDIVSFQNGSFDYAEYQKIWVDGVLQQHIEWEYDTVFTDLSGNGHDATPSFRTTSSDPDVSAGLISFAPTTAPEAPAYAVGSGPDFYSDNISITANFTSSSAGGTTGYPGQRVINALSTATATPQQLPEVLITSFIILFISIMASYWIKSAFVKMLILATGLGIGIAARDATTGLGVYDLWMLVFFMIFAILVLYASNERTRA